MRRLGVVGDLRVRHHGDIARVELDRSAVGAWLEPARLASLGAALRDAGFSRAALDLRGFRSGGLNVLAGVMDVTGAATGEPGRAASLASEARSNGDGQSGGEGDHVIRGGPPKVGERAGAFVVSRLAASEALPDAFAALGVAADVELRAGFAVLIADDVAPLRDDDVRAAVIAAVIAAAAEHGVRTVAVEARAPAEPADGQAAGRAAVHRP
jgi:hypothetical protein